MAENGKKEKSKYFTKRNILFLVLMIGTIIILIGTQYVSGSETEVTRYVNLENQYDKPVIVIINDTMRHRLST